MRYKAIIFDLDQTLVDSSALEQLRSSRQWGKVMQNLHLVRLHATLPSFLQALTESNVKVGVITNSPKMYAEKVLANHNIRYDHLIAFHDVKQRKPHPEAFLKMLQLLGVNCNECVSIGDHDNDITASKAAKIPAIGINWHSPHYQFTAVPDFQFATPQEALSHITTAI